MKDQFAQIQPDAHYLDPAEPEALKEYLIARGWLRPGELLLSAEALGEGTMNMVVRVDTGQRSFILKQARPWVESMPELPAPWNRALAEARFYELTAADAMLAEMQPRLLGLDTSSRLLALSDLGAGQDFYDLYAGARVQRSELLVLLDYLGALHALPVEPEPQLANHAMREMLHEQIFTMPLRPHNGLHLELFSEVLAREAERLRSDDAFTTAVGNLGQLYLEDGDTLLHGDFYPGSWMRLGDEIFVLDAESCFLGPPEFDLGVMLAHLVLTRQPDPGLVLRDYEGPKTPDVELALGFAGVEILRRLLGVAQLPVTMSMSVQRMMLGVARELVIRPNISILG